MLTRDWSIVCSRWPTCRQSDVERLATCGLVFRTLASFEWESNHLAHPWANAFVSIFEVYQTVLVDALRQLGWTVSAGRLPVLKAAT